MHTPPLSPCSWQSRSIHPEVPLRTVFRAASPCCPDCGEPASSLASAGRFPLGRDRSETENGVPAGADPNIERCPVASSGRRMSAPEPEPPGPGFAGGQPRAPAEAPASAEPRDRPDHPPAIRRAHAARPDLRILAGPRAETDGGSACRSAKRRPRRRRPRTRPRVRSTPAPSRVGGSACRPSPGLYH